MSLDNIKVNGYYFIILPPWLWNESIKLFPWAIQVTRKRTQFPLIFVGAILLKVGMIYNLKVSFFHIFNIWLQFSTRYLSNPAATYTVVHTVMFLCSSFFYVQRSIWATCEEFFCNQWTILIADSTPESIKRLSFPFSRKNGFLGQTATYWMAHTGPSTSCRADG